MESLSQAQAVRLSQVEMTQLVLPQFANAHGNIFGGQILSWIDICAAIAAQRHARSNVVTASMDAMQFLLPIKLEQTVILKGQVNAVFHTSMECGVSVWSENHITGERRRAMKAYATFVCLDEHGRPQPVRPAIYETDDDRRRAHAAELRRQERLRQRNAHKNRIR